MKVIIKYLIVILSLFSVCTTSAFGQEWSLGNIRKGFKGFVLGVAGGLAVHETSHYIIAKSKGVDLDLEGLSFVFPGTELPRDDHLQIASAGFQAQWIMSEIVFALNESGHKKNKGMDNLSAGFIFSHLVTTAAYLTFLTHHKFGDIEGMSIATGESNALLAYTLAIPAVFDTWRLFGKNVPPWVSKLSIASKGLLITVAWTY